MSPEDRARIARENGAKSHGPVTEEGKARSSQNALKTGEHAHKFFPPHRAVLCNESIPAYDNLIAELRAFYRPANPVTTAIVDDIAAARWQVERCQHLITAEWNAALLAQLAKPSAHADEELEEMHQCVQAANGLLAGTALIARLNREVARLHQTIARLERRLLFVQTKFPERTQPPEPAAVENTQLTDQQAAEIAKNEPPVVITESTPDVIEACRQNFPGRPILILPPDFVALGLPEDDQLPLPPRKAA